jgi:flavin-dependent dehydrogenase
MLLARAGHRVLLVDRSTFPSDIPHGHFIHRYGPRLLSKWGLLEHVVQTGCPPVTQWTYDMGDFPLVSENLVSDGVAFGYGPRRWALDAVLIGGAVDAGVEFREGFVVDGFMSDSGRITGIRGHQRGSTTAFEELASIVVGADGRNSGLAKTVAPRTDRATAPLTCWYFSYFSGVPNSGLEIYAKENGVIFAFPTNDNLFAVFVAWPARQLSVVRADIEGQFMEVVDGVPGFGERVRAGRREERFRGITDLPNFIRSAHGPGWVLVGDAGCHKDPYLALGVCDAFRDAQLAADAIDAGLSGRRPMPDALAEFERLRNEQTMPDYERNMHLAQFLPPPPDLLGVRAAVRHDPEASSLLAMALEGLIPREAFFNPENLERLMAASA